MAGRGNRREDRKQPPGISAITIQGFKSIRDETRIEICPLTLLAGANSTGKSSAMQPLLLLKQTLESEYDPGPLRLDRPNVRFTSAEQLFWCGPDGKRKTVFSIGLEQSNGASVTETFRRHHGGGIEIGELRFTQYGKEKLMYPGMSRDKILELLAPEWGRTLGKTALKKSRWYVRRERCYLCFHSPDKPASYYSPLSPMYTFVERIYSIIHVPALRGNPERAYPTSGGGPTFSGLFHSYVAAVLKKWQERSDKHFAQVEQSLENLGLTGKVRLRSIDDTRVELSVGRLCTSQRTNSNDLVNIADAGFGLSQVLPVIVALLVAKRGQLVHVEQPEIHLHPRAQVAMAGLLAKAAKRGVRVVIETHSALILLGVQTLVANGELPPHLVKLHWFERDKDGATHVHSGDLDEKGRFGDWPEDFGRVELLSEKEYLDAVHK
jgi:hypothetical protein